MALLRRQPEGDYTAREFLRILRGADEHYPLSDAMEARRSYSVDHWYRSQREHVLGWLGEYGGAGAYGRKGTAHTARFFWNHFQCPPGLVWVAEAMGVDKSACERAVSASIAAEECGGNLASQCAAIRKVVTWEMVYRATKG